jgi:hypothetical protein
MSYETRAYDTPGYGEPVVVMVVTGTHDVSRFVNLLHTGTCEQHGVGAKLLRQVRRHNGGRAALRLLRYHGGPDFTSDERTEEELARLIRVAILDPGHLVKRGWDSGWNDYERLDQWQDRAVQAVLAGAGTAELRESDAGRRAVPA